MLHIYISELSAKDLAAIAQASKFLFVFAQTDILWKELYLEEYEGDFDFVGSWKETLIRKKTGVQQLPPKADIHTTGMLHRVIFDWTGIYSDVLYNSHYCATIDPCRWAQIDNIDRRSNLSVEEFIEQYESKGIPVILQDVVKE